MTRVPRGAEMTTKGAGDKARRLDPVPAALEGGVETGQEVVKVGGDDAHAFGQGSRVATEDEGHAEHGPGEEFDGDLDDEEVGLLAAVVLGIGVDEGKDQGGGEDGGAEVEPGSCLEGEAVS